MKKKNQKKQGQYSVTYYKRTPKGIIFLIFRTDLWSMYVDLELKHGSLDRAREIMERCLTIKLKRKKMIAMLKKYHQIEENYGTVHSAAEILNRAQKIA